MKPLILIISITVVLFVQIWVTFGARSREFDLYTDFMLAREGFKDTVSCVGNSFISMGRVVSYSWLRTGRHLFNFHFALNYKDAEYFFYQEQKSRDKKVRLLKDGRLRRIKYFGRTFKSGEEAEHYEYYCQDQNPKKLINYCNWALENEHLKKKIDWTYDEEGLPHCEFKVVHLKRYNFKSKRMFLKCPVLARRKDEPEHQSSIYISSVKNAPSNRLLLYLFIMSPPRKPGWSDESSMSQSVGDRSVSDLSERQEMTPQVEEPTDLGSIQEVDEFESARNSERSTEGMTSDKEKEEIETTDVQDTKGKTPVEAGSSSALTIRDTVVETPPSKVSTVVKTPPSKVTTRRLSIRDSETTEKTPSDYQRRRSSMSTRTFSRDSRGRLKQMETGDEEASEEGESYPLEIITLLINKRHTLKTTKKMDREE